MDKLCCPKCKTNKSRFYIIEQNPKAVKFNVETSEIEHEYTSNVTDPFFVQYAGPEYRVQCGVCGLIDNPDTFVAAAKLTSN